MSETIDLGNGNRLVLTADLDHLDQLPGVKAALRAKAYDAAAYANSIAVTKPGDDPRPLYYVRYRGGEVGVLPDSFKGVVDDATHSTLLKVIAREGADHGT